MKTPKNIDEYIAGFPPDVQEYLEQIRVTIKKAARQSEEKISYGIPAFTLGGRMLIYFAAHKKHIGIYPVPTGNKALAFAKDFSAYKTSGKGTIQFPYGKPMPLSLVTKIVKFRINENQERAK